MLIASLNAWGGAMYTDLLADVRALLPHHQPLFVTSDFGPVTGDDGARHRQAFGLGTFVADHLMIIKARASTVHGTFTEHDEWPPDNRPRAALALQLVEPGAGRAVTLVHLHGLRDRRGKVDTPDRRAQAERIVDLVETADTRTSQYAKPVRHAGYVLVSDPAAVRRFEILTEPEVSDHRALLLEI